jgi:ATP-dependent DNA helicase RecG
MTSMKRVSRSSGKRCCIWRISGKALESREKILEELELIKDGKLTVAAVLLSIETIKSGTRRIHTYCKMRNDADVVSSDEIKGSLMMLSRSILDILKVKYLYALISYDMPTRIETYPYPFDALREAVFNSLMHNDWSSGQSILIKVYDHRSAYSTGLFVDEDWTVEHHKSRHINPLISNAFNKAGLVEKFGTGITKMIDSCKDAGNPEPLFETASTGLDF